MAALRYSFSNLEKSILKILLLFQYFLTNDPSVIE